MSGRQKRDAFAVVYFSKILIKNKYIRNPYIYSMPESPKKTESKQTLIDEYLRSLDEMELIAYNIAKSHLGTLFSVEKSNHYLEWLKARSA